MAAISLSVSSSSGFSCVSVPATDAPPSSLSLPTPIVYSFMPTASAAVATVMGSSSPALFTPSVISVTSLLSALESFNMFAAVAIPLPIAVPILDPHLFREVDVPEQAFQGQMVQRGRTLDERLS